MVDQSKPISDIVVNVNVDCGKAIKDLKALQREARGATQALKELSHVWVGVDLAHDAGFTLTDDGRLIDKHEGESFKPVSEVTRHE
jgi:hypothetical protein